MESIAVLKLAGASFVALVIALVVVIGQDGRRKNEPRGSDASRVLLGVLGDSDSAAYQDHVSFPDAGERPGGAFHSITLQWPEVVAQVRPSQVDLGEWAVWGVLRWASLARVRDGLGLPWRGPRKETLPVNFQIVCI